MPTSKHYFNFLGKFLDLLPNEDKDRLAETWTAYEQVFASVYQKNIENDLNIAIDDMQPYHSERWLPYEFNESSQVLRPAIYTSTQDLSVGVRLDNRYLLKFRINEGDAFEVDCRGVEYLSTKINEVVTKINFAAGFDFARTIFDGTIIQLVSPTTGPDSRVEILQTSDPSKNASEIILGLNLEDIPQTYPKYPYVYQVQYDSIVNIPTLQTKIREETEGYLIIREIEDYEVNSQGLLCFKSEPAEKLWARKTMVNKETPWHNFGFLMGIHQENSPGYLNVLQGLWYSFWTGPTPSNVRNSLYLLFGLPTAQEDSTVTKITDNNIETLSEDGIQRTYTVPPNLESIVTVGQQLTRFEPLVSGIDVLDKVNYPGFIKTDIGRAGVERFLTENASRGPGPDTDESKALDLLEEHTFLPQISVESFVSSNIDLGNVQLFLKTIKPLNKAFLFQIIVGEFREKVDLKERLSIGISIDVTPNTDSNQTTRAEQDILDDYEDNANGALDTDSDGLNMGERLEVEVRSFGSLIDNFDV